MPTLLLVLSASQSASGQTPHEAIILDALNVHRSHCGFAFTDPEAFLAEVQTTYPVGTFAVVTSPDSRIFRLSISTGQGRYNTQYSRYFSARHGEESCATYVLVETENMMGDPTNVAQTLEAVMTEQVGGQSVFGGQVDQYYADAMARSDVLLTDHVSYEYVFDDVLPGANAPTLSHVALGHLSLVSTRRIEQ